MDKLGPPYVIKADGLAAGKGVVVTQDRDEAVTAVENSLVQGGFGAAGSSVVVEEFLDGPEVSLIAFCDGDTVVPCEPAQDYKRAFDGDAGPNTGGMGSYSPVPQCPQSTAEEITTSVIEPGRARVAEPRRLRGRALRRSGSHIRRAAGDRVQRALRRSRDPGAHSATAFGLWRGCAGNGSARTRRCASRVVRGRMRFGRPCVEGLSRGATRRASRSTVSKMPVRWTVSMCFHAGTARDGDRIVTAGGRVLAVSALGKTFSEARSRAYRAADQIEFEGKHVRTDIALRAEQQEGN